MADWNPQPHNDLPQNSQKIKLCIVLWETFVLPGSGCDYGTSKVWMWVILVWMGSKSYEHEETGMLRTEQQNLQQHTQLWHDVILYSITQQTSIYSQICKKKLFWFCILTTVNSKLLLQRINRKGKVYKGSKELFSHSKGELLVEQEGKRSKGKRGVGGSGNSTHSDGWGCAQRRRPSCVNKKQLSCLDWTQSRW